MRYGPRSRKPSLTQLIYSIQDNKRVPRLARKSRKLTGKRTLSIKEQICQIKKTIRNTIYKKPKSSFFIKQLYWKPHENSISSNDENDGKSHIQRKFWNHIKARKTGRDRHTSTKGKGKAEILFRQYQSVFSKEDPSNIPKPPSISRQLMPKVKVVKDNQAAGPDHIT